MKYEQIQTIENYEKLLKSGMFWEIYPELTGNYAEDYRVIHPHRFEEALDKFIQHNFTYLKENPKIMFTYEIFTDRYSTIVVANNMADAIQIVFEDDPKAVVLCAVDIIHRDEFFREQNPEDRPY